MSKTKEAIRLIRNELGELRTLLTSISDRLTGLDVALGEWNHDIEGRQERQDQGIESARTRLNTVERETIPKLAGRVTALERPR